MTHGKQLLEQAIGTLAQREKEYGHIALFADELSARWSITLGHKIAPEQVLLCMIDLKLTRLQANAMHRDSMVDIAGYIACFAELMKQGSEA